MSANSGRFTSLVGVRASSGHFQIQSSRRRNRLKALSAAVGAVSVLGLTAGHALADVYSFDYSSTFATDLSQSGNWFDTTSGQQTGVPGSGDIAQFDNVYTDFSNPPPSFVLSSAAAGTTSWGGIVISNPDSSNLYENSVSGTNTFVFATTNIGPGGATGLIIGSSGITVAGTVGLAISASTTLGAAQTWTVPAISAATGVTTGPSVTNSTPQQAITVSGPLSLGGNGSLALTFAGAGDVTISGVISDGGAASGINLASSYSGTLTLNAPVNTYSGGTNLGGGEVSISNIGSIGTGGITFAGGALQITGTGITNLNTTLVNGVTGANANWAGFPVNLDISNAANTFTVSQNIVDGGKDGSVAKYGGGTLVLSGNNTYSGGTTIAGGALVVPGFSALGNPTGTVTNSGTLQLNLASPYSFPNSTYGSSYAGTGALVSGGAALTINAPITNTSVGAVAGGQLILDFTNQSSPITASTATLVDTGGTIQINPNATTAVAQTFATTALGGGTNVITASGIGAGLVVNLGTLTRANISYGTTVQFNGPVNGTVSAFQINSTSTAATLLPTPNGHNTVPFATYGLDDYAAITASSNGVSYIVPGTVLGTNFYTAVGTGTGVTMTNNADINAPGEVRASGTQAPVTIRFNTPTGGLFNGFGGNIDQIVVKTESSKALEFNSVLVTPNVGANNVMIGSDSAGNTVNGILPDESTAEDMVIYQNDTQNALVFETGISTTGTTLAITKQGPGIWAIDDPYSNWAGGTYVDGGIIELQYSQSVGALPTATNNNSVNLNGGSIMSVATLSLDNGQTGGSLVGRNINVGAGGGGLIAAQGTTFTVDGNIAGSGNLTLGSNQTLGNTTSGIETAIIPNFATSEAITFGSAPGAGKIIISGAANTFSGNATVSAGNAQVDGAFTSPAAVFTLSNGGILSGTGSISGGVVVQSGGTLFAGDSGSGTFTAGSVSTNTGGNVQFAFTVAGPVATSANLVDIPSASGFKIGSGTDLVLFGNGSNLFETNGTYVLFQVAGANDPLNVNGLQVANPQILTTYNFGTNTPAGANYTDVTMTVNSQVVTTEWKLAGGGSWISPSSWNGGVPNGEVDIAIFGSNPGITSPSTVTVDGPEVVGTIDFNNANGYTVAPGTGGSITYENNGSAGILGDLAGNHVISAPVILTSGLNASVASGATMTLSGGLSGTGPLTLTGPGTLVLSGNIANSYSGATTINSGTLQLGDGTTTGLLGNTLAVVDNGTLALNLPTSTTFTLANSISGSGGLSATGNALVILSGTNTYKGSTTLSGSTVQLASSSAASSSSALIMSGATIDINGTSPTFGSPSGTGTIDNVSAGGTPTVTFNTTSTTTFSGVIKNTTGTVGVVVTGSSTAQLTLAGNNTYSGQTTIEGGAGLRIATSTTLNPVSQINDNDTDGIILSNGVVLTNTIAENSGTNEFINLPDANESATMAGPVNVTAGGAQYRLGFSNTTATLYVTGASTVAVNDFTFVTEGNVVFNGTGSLTANMEQGATSGDPIGFGRATVGLNLLLEGSSSITNLGATGLNFGNGSADPGVNVTIQGQASVNVGSGGVELEGSVSSTVNVSNTLTLNGGTLTAGGFTFTPTVGSESATVNVTLNGGTIIAGASNENFLPANSSLPAAATFSLNVGAGGAIFDTNGFNEVINTPQGFNSIATPDGGLTKNGAGRLVLGSQFGKLNGTTYNGNTIVNGGLVEFESDNQLSSGGSLSYIQVSAGGAVGIANTSPQTGSTSDTKFLQQLLAAPHAQAGGFALSSYDSAVDIDYTGTVAGAFNMTNVSVSGGASGVSIANMSVGAVSGLATSAGTDTAPVIYTGTITPPTLSGKATYLLGGGGTLELQAPTTGANAVANGGTGVPIINAAAGIAGISNVLAENGGTVWLAEPNTYSGVTTVNGVMVTAVPGADLPSGVTSTMLETTTLAVSDLGDPGSADGSSLGTSAPGNAANLVLNGGILQYLGAGDTTVRMFTIGQLGAGLDSSGAGPIDLSNAASEPYAAGVTGPVSLTLSGSFGSVGPVGSPSLVNVLAAQLSDPSTGQLSLVKNGAGVWALTNGNNSYSGGTTINAGVLEIAAPNPAPASFPAATTVLGSTSGALTINTGGTLDLNGNNVSAGVLSGGGTVDDIVAGGTSNLSVGNGIPTTTTSTFSGVIQNTTGAVSLTVTGSNLTLTGVSNTYTGGTSLTGGILAITSDAAINNGVGGVSFTGGTLQLDNYTSSLTFANSVQLGANTGSGATLVGAVTGTGSLTYAGPGSLTLTGANTYSGGTTITAGSLVIGAAGGLPSGSTVSNSGVFSIEGNSTSGTINGTGSLAIGNNATLQLAAGSGASSTSSLTISSGSTLDVTNNKLTINYGSGADPAATIRAELISGLNGTGGKWTGTGITSSLAAANPTAFAVGYADGGNPVDVANTASGINPVSAGQVEIVYTVAGDVNLSGGVDLSDLVIVASDFGQSGDDWAQGDLNYDGNVDLSDLVIVASNFGASLSSVQDANFNGSFQAEWKLALAEVHGADVQVPEPASVTLLAVGASGLLARRRRRSNSR
jgi:fibronectin-binding autotransporter adhesin